MTIAKNIVQIQDYHTYSGEGFTNGDRKKLDKVHQILENLEQMNLETKTKQIPSIHQIRIMFRRKRAFDGLILGPWIDSMLQWKEKKTDFYIKELKRYEKEGHEWGMTEEEHITGSLFLFAALPDINPHDRFQKIRTSLLQLPINEIRLQQLWICYELMKELYQHRSILNQWFIKTCLEFCPITNPMEIFLKRMVRSMPDAHSIILNHMPYLLDNKMENFTSPGWEQWVENPKSKVDNILNGIMKIDPLTYYVYSLQILKFNMSDNVRQILRRRAIEIGNGLKGIVDPGLTVSEARAEIRDQGAADMEIQLTHLHDFIQNIDRSKSQILLSRELIFDTLNAVDKYSGYEHFVYQIKSYLYGLLIDSKLSSSSQEQSQWESIRAEIYMKSFPDYMLPMLQMRNELEDDFLKRMKKNPMTDPYVFSRVDDTQYIEKPAMEWLKEVVNWTQHESLQELVKGCESMLKDITWKGPSRDMDFEIADDICQHLSNHLSLVEPTEDLNVLLSEMSNVLADLY